jgi:hypothetical protein
MGGAADKQLVLLRQAGRSHDQDLALVPLKVVDRFFYGAPVGNFNAHVVPAREPVGGCG